MGLRPLLLELFQFKSTFKIHSCDFVLLCAQANRLMAKKANLDFSGDVPLMQNDLIESHQRRSKSNKARNSRRILGISNHAASGASESETTRAKARGGGVDTRCRCRFFLENL